MRILITAGNTRVPIDQVRCITNIFTGRTGTRIAVRAYERGHQVFLLTSHPELAGELAHQTDVADRWTVHPYQTFEELQQQMASAVRNANLDAVIHCAAVSDYRTEGVYAPSPGTYFDDNTRHWTSSGHGLPELVDRRAGKIRSSEPEIWIRLVRTSKIIDQVRTEWGFKGVLVKFKLEVGISEEDLMQIAAQSLRQSAADLVVANTLAGSSSWAYVGPIDGRYEKVNRQELPARLIEVVEHMREGRGHG